MSEYTREESTADIEAWKAATEKQRAEAFWALRGIVGADAQLGDKFCAAKLREIAAKRDEVKP